MGGEAVESRCTCDLNRWTRLKGVTGPGNRGNFSVALGFPVPSGSELKE